MDTHYLKLTTIIQIIFILNYLEAAPIVTKTPPDAAKSQGNTIMDNINNFNMDTYALMSNSFKTLQNKFEDLMYSGPIGKVSGPLATATNLVTGYFNDKNDELMQSLYHGVRDNLGLKGTVRTHDFNIPRPQVVQRKPPPPVSVERQQQMVNSDLDALDALF